MPEFAKAGAFLLAALAIYSLRKHCSEREKNRLNYIFIGFLAGGIGKVFLTIIKNYIIQVPLLPSVLSQQGLAYEEISRIVSTYSIILVSVDVILIYAVTMLIAYGVYIMITGG